jgi:hypothetical protein
MKKFALILALLSGPAIAADAPKPSSCHVWQDGDTVIVTDCDIVRVVGSKSVGITNSTVDFLEGGHVRWVHGVTIDKAVNLVVTKSPDGK